MSEDNVIDVEVVEVVETPNLPAVVEHQAWSGEGLGQDTVTRKSGKTYGAKPGRTAEGLSLDAAAVARHDAALAANAERQCSGKNSKGERCRKFAIAGSSCCRTHGGATAHVANKARIRVQNASNKLVGKLIEFAFDDTKPPETQLRAIRDALDRGGLKPPSEVVLSQGEPKPWETVFDSIGGTPSSESPSVAWGYDSAGLGTDVADVGIVAPPTQPHSATPTVPRDQARPRSEGIHADSYSGEYVDASADDDPPRQPRPRERDRDRHDQPPSRHITGDNAMRAANWANRAMAETHGLPWGESDRRRR